MNKVDHGQTVKSTAYDFRILLVSFAYHSLHSLRFYGVAFWSEGRRGIGRLRQQSISPFGFDIVSLQRSNSLSVSACWCAVAVAVAVVYLHSTTHK